MKKFKPLLWIAFACVSFTSLAQAEPGIKWTSGLSLEQVKQKAKQENKYVFIDCYTTWCTFCKKMDGETYLSSEVGNYFNDKFISVKVQFDQTPQDSPEVKAWYNDAKSLSSQCLIEGYPTFIFLSPDGKIVHKEAGYKTSDQFIDLAKLALQPGKTYSDDRALFNQYQEAYKAGEKHYDQFPLMIRIAERFDQDLRRNLTRELAEHMATLPRDQRYTEEIVKLWERHNFNPKHPVIKFYKEDGDLIDKIMNYKGYSAMKLDESVQAVTVAPFFEEQAKGSGVAMTGGGPVLMTGSGGILKIGKTTTVEADWPKLEQKIADEYGKEIVKRAMLSAHIDWYNKHQNSPMALKYSLMKFKQFPPNVKKEGGLINHIAWNAFLESTDQKALKECAEWIEKVVAAEPKASACMDTYAQILYKINQKEKAIEWESKAAALSQKEYDTVVEDMKKNYPTYVDYGANWQGINHVNWDGFKFEKIVIVKTEDKKPLTGVSVLNKRTKETKVTTEKGVVGINVSLGDVLVISCPGYPTQELKVTKEPGFFDLIFKPGN